MARIENSTIIFESKEEMDNAQKKCSKCSLNLHCGGVDEKINGAAINDAIGFKATNIAIISRALCLRRK